MKSRFSFFAMGTSFSLVLTLIRACGISVRKILLAWMSIHTSAPSRSSQISAATYSVMLPSRFPGNRRFMSRSNAGIPRVRESMPSGFIAG